MRFSLLGLWLIALPLFAAEQVNFRNDREGKTYYSSWFNKRAMNNALKQVDSTQILGAFEETLKELEPNKLCAYDLNSSFREKLKSINPRFSSLQGAIIYLRTQNELDDTVSKLLLEADETVTTTIAPKDEERLFLPYDRETVAKALDAISSFEKKLKTNCFDDAYRTLYGDILKYNKGLKSHHFEALFYEALQDNVISEEIYQRLEQARANELESKYLTLKAYYKKIKSLRSQYPLRDPEEKSDFVSEKADKIKMSRRQRLMENYTDLQIILMANVIKSLRTRLDSPKAEILIYDRQNGIETITLEPMERFRLAIKLLRKEMSHLALNTYFAGRSPDYIDLMTAAYEVGIIPASELEEVAALKDVWDPKKTFWEKARIWVRTIGSVATIAVPPPYGFIPALAIVVIEMTTLKNEDNSDDPTVLF